MLTRWLYFLSLLHFWISFVILFFFFSYSTSDISLILKDSTFRPAVRNSTISNDATKLEGTERKFVAFCCSRFVPSDGEAYSYTNALQLLILRIFHDRRHRPDEIVVINGFWRSKSCPSSTDITGLRVPTRRLRDFPLFHIRPFS